MEASLLHMHKAHVHGLLHLGPGQPAKTNENQRYRETCQPTSMSILLETLKT